MSGRRLAAVALLGLVAAWLLGAAVAYRLGSPAEVAALLERVLGRGVSIGDVGVTFLPWPSVALEDVRIADGLGADLEVPVVRAYPALGALLRGEIRVGHVILHRPRVRLAAGASGAASAAGRTSPSGAPSGTTRVAQSAGRRRERPPVDVRVVDGRVIAHRQSGPPLRCMGLRATGSVAGGVVRGRVDDGACRLGDASVESIQAAGQVRVGRGRPVVRAYVSGRRLTTGRVYAEHVQGPLRVGPRGIRFGRAQLLLGGGRAELRVRAGDRPGPGRLAVWLTGRGRSLQGLLDEQVVTLRGRWTAAVWLRGPLSAQRGFRRRLHGTGRLVLLDGVVGPVSLGAALRDAVGRWGGRERGRTLRDTHPDLFGRQQIRFDRLSASFVLRRGRVRTTDLEVRSRSYAAAGRVSVGFDGSLRGHVQVRASPELTANLLGAGSLRALATGGGEALDVPLRIGGSVLRPNVRPDSSYTRDIVDRLLGRPGASRALERAFER